MEQASRGESYLRRRLYTQFPPENSGGSEGCREEGSSSGKSVEAI